MHIMFVCTGNVCRSPMGELLMRRYLSGTSITVSSAGTHALVGHPIDPSSGRLMDSVGIDSGEFRSRQLTRELAENADLILCFEEEQRNNIVDMAPAVVRRTFLVTDFANMCLYCAQHDLVKGLTVQERLNSVIEASSFIRPMIPAPRDVEDPFTKDFPVFRKAANQTNKAIWIILNSMRKHYRVNGAPARTMIEHAKETQPVAAEPASAEPVEISLPVFAPYQSNAAETEVMKPVHVAPVKTVPAQMAPAQAQPVTRSVTQAVSQPSPVSVMSEQPVTAQPSPAPLSPPTPPKPAPPLTVVMPDVPNFNVNVTGGITPTSGE